jgi:patatin-like phospholipase/acyl hydrolase
MGAYPERKFKLFIQVSYIKIPLIRAKDMIIFTSLKQEKNYTYNKRECKTTSLKSMKNCRQEYNISVL